MGITENSAAQIANGLYTSFLESVKAYKENNNFDFLSVGYEDAHEKVGKVVTDFATLIKGANYEGYAYPKFIVNHRTSATVDGEKLDAVSLTIRSGLKSKSKYSVNVTIPADKVIDMLETTFAEHMTQMFYTACADENVELLNNYIAGISEELDVKIQFALSDKYVTDITDSSVTFGISTASALDILSLNILHSGEEYNDFSNVLAQEETEKFVASVRGKTSVQLIKGVALVEELIGRSKKRADRILRLTYHKNAQFIDSAKSGIGYVNKTITVDGEEVEIFGLIEKDSEGKISTKLSPFNIKTSFNVDYDITKPENYNA